MLSPKFTFILRLCSPEVSARVFGSLGAKACCRPGYPHLHTSFSRKNERFAKKRIFRMAGFLIFLFLLKLGRGAT